MTDAVCQLCVAERYTTWYYEDELCWVAECESCSVPMVVWKQHGTEPLQDEIEAMIERLSAVAEVEFVGLQYRIDRVMRQIPEHFHAHARKVSTWLR